MILTYNYYTPRTTKLLGGILVSLRPSVCPSVRPSVCPACRVCSVTSTVLDGFFPYYPQMITTMRGCVIQNDLWPWPISWIFGILKKNFGLDLQKKYLQFSKDVLTQMITSMRGCIVYNDLWPWPISSWSFGIGLENRVRSVASTVLHGLFPYFIQMITSIRRCVACDDLWPWPIYIFKVIRPWHWKSCPLCNVFSSRSIISIFVSNNHYH